MEDITLFFKVHQLHMYIFVSSSQIAYFKTEAAIEWKHLCLWPLYCHTFVRNCSERGAAASIYTRLVFSFIPLPSVIDLCGFNITTNTTTVRLLGVFFVCLFGCDTKGIIR